jgi:plastocyanin
MLSKAQTFAMIGIVLSGVTLFSLFASAEEGLIPSWIKTTAGFWVNEQVSDSEFISALQFMITNGIIQVPTQEDSNVKELQDENEQLKTEIASLKSQLNFQSTSTDSVKNDFKEFVETSVKKPDGKTIEILGLEAPSYSPNTVTIKAGETLTFDNVDAIVHTVTSGNRATGPDRNFNSDLLSAGEKFTLTLDKQGTYQYYCRIHPNMVGTIIVS